MTTCRAVRKDGQPCGTMTNLSADGFCLWHDPARASVAAAARAKGQKAAKAGQQLAVIAEDEEMPPLDTLEDCANFLAWLTYAVGRGKIATAVAKEMTSAVKERRYILLNIADVTRRVREVKRAVAAAGKEPKA